MIKNSQFWGSKNLYAMDNKQSTLGTPTDGKLPFAEAMRAGDLLFISGQIGMDPGKGLLANGSFGEEAVQVMRNLGLVLQRHGLQYGDLVNVTIYLTDMGNYSETNRVYRQFFTDAFPARVCVAVKELPMGATIEISAVAFFK